MVPKKTRMKAALLIVAALVMLGALTEARADVKIWTWAVEQEFEEGAVCIYSNVVYKCKSAHTATPFNYPPNAALWEQMNEWDTGNTYAVGNLVYYGNPVDIYRCNQAHLSTSENAPGNTPPWHKPFPKDPAVTTGGHGPSGNDYIDYYQKDVDDAAMFYTDSVPPPFPFPNYQTRICVIKTDNPNYDVAKNHISAPSAWNSTTTYPMGRQVTHEGDTYQAKVESTDVEPPDPAYW